MTLLLSQLPEHYIRVTPKICINSTKVSLKKTTQLREIKIEKSGFFYNSGTGTLLSVQWCNSSLLGLGTKRNYILTDVRVSIYRLDSSVSTG